MPLSRLENFLRNAEGNILYVSPTDFDATDSFENQGNSLTRPFKTIQRALIEAARFSYQNGRNNDKIDRTTILVYPGTHYIDNRPGFSLTASGSNAVYKKRTDATTWTATSLNEFGTNTNYDILDTNNDLYKFNSVNGGVILPRGTSIIGYDLRKTKIRPLYVPNPEDSTVDNSSIFNVTGTCYFSTFTFLDADTTKTVFRDYTDSRFVPNYSHNKLVSFAYADGVNKVVLGTEQTDLTDLDMYYYKVARAYGDLTGRGVLDYPSNNDFESSVDEYRIVGSLQANPFGISSIYGGDGITNPKNVITVTTKDFLTGDDKPHGLSVDSPVLISGITVDSAAFNGSFTVKEVVGLTTFTYTSTSAPANATPVAGDYESGIVTIEADTVSSASPYVFNCSLRSVYGLCGMWADGSKADGFKSMVVAQYTGVSLQKDDNAFLIYENGTYQSNLTLDVNSTQRPLHTNGNAIYKPDYENTHIRVSNNGFVQCVSIFAIGFAKHFLTESGGDMSITNSNSNFGAISLESTGFRNESFDRDDVGYITHIIPPKEVDDIETDVTWLSLDVSKIISVGTTSNLYLYNYKNIDSKPSHQVDNYRIGAKLNDNLNLTVVVGTSQTTYSTPILMPVPDGTGVSSKKSYTVTRTGTQNNISNNTFSLGSNHQLYNGEKIRIFSDTSQAPDGISVDTVYYAITTGLGANEIKLAYSLNDAVANQPITGINNNGGVLTVVSSVTDKIPGDLGHPIQYDTAQNNWYIVGTASSTTNQIYKAVVDYGVAILGNETASTFVKRKVDSRSIEDRIYRVRYVIPKEFTNARPPQAGFVLQESKTVGVSTISFDNTYTLSNTTPPAYLRNEKIISNATVGAVSNGSQIVTITTELPHQVAVGDKVKIQKVRSTNNSLGVGLTSTYNGSYTVLSVPSTKQFTYQISGVKINPGTYSNLINERDTRQERDQLPLVSREQYSGHYFIYRVNTIKNHVPGTQGQDGIYNLIVLSSNVKPSANIGYGISQKSFNQDVRNLYPQIDRDNFNADPLEAISFADAKTLGKVITGDRTKSITKEAINSFVKNTRIGFGITGITLSGTGNTTITVYTDIEHTLNSLKLVSRTNQGAGYGNTTIYASSLTGGSGVNGSLRADLVAGTVQSVSIVDPGSAYVVGDALTISGSPGITPTINATVSVTEINNNVGDGIELSGFNQPELNGVYRILSVPSSKSFTIYNASAPASYSANTNGRLPVAVLASKGVGITSFRFDTVTTGIVTVTTSTSHGLLPGNKFTIVGSGHTIYDKSFFVKDNIGINTFTFYVGIVTQTRASTTGILLKHGISANALSLTRGEENLGSRASYIYAGITTSLTTTLTTSSSTVGLSSAAGFNRGDYILINAEILRLASAPTGNTFTVLRGRFSTYKTTADIGTQVKKIDVLPMEVRRPSFMRASGHTFEYLGYGPGNYSTGMPQKQTRTLSEDDVLTSQAREQSGGTVVYTGMNDLGEFYSGSKKLSSATGEEKVIDAPIITFTGDDSQGENENRLSGIFDDVLVKERITVEGGDSGNQSSQFYGPVNFTKKVTNTADDGINTKNLFIKGTASQGKLITVGISTPISSNLPSTNSGDISLKANPTDKCIGQVYVNNEWKKFGLISDSADILDIKVDRLGIGDTSIFTNVGGIGDAEFYVAGDTKLQNLTITGSTTFTSNVVLSDVNFDIINVRKTANFSGIGGTTFAIYVDGPTVGNSNTALKTRLYDLQVANSAYALGSVGIGTTNPTVKLDIIGNTKIGGNLTVNDGDITINHSGGTGDIIANGGSDGIFGIFNSTNSGSIRLYVKDSGGTNNAIINATSGIATVNGTLNVSGNTTSGGFDFILGNTDQSSRGNSGSSRALVKDSSSTLALNYGGDFSGGVRVDSNISIAGTTTVYRTSTGTETRGTFLRLTNAGNGGDSVISWDSTYNNANQRWYAGIDVSDGYAWKLAKPDTVYFNDENFDRNLGGGNIPETKLKIDTSGNATFLGNLNTGTTLTVGDGVNNGNIVCLSINSNRIGSVSGDRWTKIPVIGADGVMEVGRYIDFHSTAGDTTDNTFRIDNNTNGNLSFSGNISVTGSATVGTTLGVTNGVTASSFTVSGASNQSLLLRATGTALALTKTELDAAAGFVIQPPVVNSTLPNGNSLQLIPLTFDGVTRTFALRNPDTTLFTPISAANLLVSVAGVVRKPDTDYTVAGSNITFPASAWPTPPAAGLSCFIIAFGGLGGLTQNYDWNGVKGELLVGSATDNLGVKLAVGVDGSILTADSTTASGLSWNSSINISGSITGTSLSAGSGTITGGAITGTTITGTSFSGNGITPIGGIIMWNGSIADAVALQPGWALCDGRTVNGRTTPDLRDKFIVGASSGTGDTTYPGLSAGATGGSADAVIVSHTHRPDNIESNSGFRYNYALTSDGLGGSPVTTNLRVIEGVAGGNGTYTTTAGPVFDASGNALAGSSATNANLPPYYALAFIMRTA